MSPSRRRRRQALAILFIIEIKEMGTETLCLKPFHCLGKYDHEWRTRVLPFQKW